MTQNIIDDKYDFNAEMDSNPAGIYLVEVFEPDGKRGPSAVFSKVKLAEDWIKANISDDWTCLVIPYVIDEPEFGSDRSRLS